MVWVGREFTDHVVPTSCHGWNSQNPWDLVVSITSVMILPDYIFLGTKKKIKLACTKLGFFE